MKGLAEWNRFRVGLVGLGVLAFLATLVGAFAGLHVGAHTYTAELEHTGGLRPGEEVQVAGVGVGEVTSIELGDRVVRVRFTVDGDLDLGSESTAEVKVATLLGTHFLLVSPRGTGELADDTIPVARTSVPFNLQDVLDEAAPELQDFDTDQIDRALTQLATTLEASGGELGPALDGVRDLSSVVAARSDELGALLRAARAVTEQLVDSGGDLVELLRQADLILDTLTARRDTIHGLLRDMASLGEALSGIVDDTRADVRPTLRDLDIVLTVLRRHEQALDEAIRMLAPTARYFANGAGTGPWLDQHVPGGIPDNLECELGRVC